MPVKITEELKPCPFCGNEDIREVQGGSWCVCDECGCEGPDKDGGDRIVNWNRRAALTQAAEQPATQKFGNYNHEQLDYYAEKYRRPSPPCDSRTEALEEALRFYADKKNWMGGPWVHAPPTRPYGTMIREPSAIEADQGSLAIHALSEAGRSALKEE